jgi:hypothetical protein
MEPQMNFGSSLYRVGATDKRFRQANPSHCEGIAGRFDPARPSNGSFMTSRISNVTRRCPPARLH